MYFGLHILTTLIPFFINLLALGNLSAICLIDIPSSAVAITKHFTISLISGIFLKFDSTIQFLTNQCDKCHNYKAKVKLLNFIEKHLLAFSTCPIFFCPPLYR
jgi:hypothetical protein